MQRLAGSPASDPHAWPSPRQCPLRRPGLSQDSSAPGERACGPDRGQQCREGRSLWCPRQTLSRTALPSPSCRTLWRRAQQQGMPGDREFLSPSRVPRDKGLSEAAAPEQGEQTSSWLTCPAPARPSGLCLRQPPPVAGPDLALPHQPLQPPTGPVLGACGSCCLTHTHPRAESLTPAPRHQLGAFAGRHQQSPRHGPGVRCWFPPS